jgi:predicted nucleic acid-binding protein
MKKVFVDTDIIFDLLAKREPFYPFAARLFTLSDREKIAIHVSSLSFANLNYILSRFKSSVEARKILSRFKVLVKVLPVNDKIIELALNSEFKDFKDANQYYCAIENGLPVIITRNVKDFKKSKIAVLTAEEFIKKNE